MENIISHKLPFFDSARFMSILLLNLGENFPEGTYKIKRKYRREKEMWNFRKRMWN